ncbi:MULTISPECIES: YolD-like family protein [unclassified Paenibacillus]|uniref:YolD-like family protein n=1 Tax=unclassified Paenibacillus TaxID=185978 RepID=UPI00363F0ACA
MMLPEHKNRINRVYGQKKKMKLTKPALTDEEQQELFRRLKVSKSQNLEASITLFRDSGNRTIFGIVTSIDPRYALIKVESGPSWEVFQFSDVIRVDLHDAGY